MTQQCDTTTMTYMAVGGPESELLRLADFSRGTGHFLYVYRDTALLRSLECRALRVLSSSGDLQGATSPCGTVVCYPYVDMQDCGSDTQSLVDIMAARRVNLESGTLR